MTNFVKPQKRRAVRFMALAAASVITLAGCVSPVAGPSGKYATPIGSAPVTSNPTPYSASLNCLAQFAKQNNIPRPRVAVGRILDYTGKADLEGGRKVTQGASLMAISAFAKADGSSEMPKSSSASRQPASRCPLHKVVTCPNWCGNSCSKWISGTMG